MFRVRLILGCRPRRPLSVIDGRSPRFPRCEGIMFSVWRRLLQEQGSRSTHPKCRARRAGCILMIDLLTCAAICRVWTWPALRGVDTGSCCCPRTGCEAVFRGMTPPWPLPEQGYSSGPAGKRAEPGRALRPWRPERSPRPHGSNAALDAPGGFSIQCLSGSFQRPVGCIWRGAGSGDQGSWIRRSRELPRLVLSERWNRLPLSGFVLADGSPGAIFRPRPETWRRQVPVPGRRGKAASSRQSS